MADPGNPSREPNEAEFSPAELDRLEDALELWTASETVPEDSSLPAPLRARLGEYRDVLALSREALALEDVPDGLLASVLEEAHASAASVTPIPARRTPAGPSLWERLRRSLLLPGVALAGSTVMLLWLVQPRDGAEELIAERSTPSQSAPNTPNAPNMAPAPAPELARLAPGEGPAPAGPLPAEPAAAAPQDVREDAGSPPRAEEAAPEAKAPSLEKDSKSIAGSKADKPVTKASRSKDLDAAADPIEVLPGLDDAPTQDADKEALRDTLEQADTRRRGGRCDAAMALYEQAFGMSGPDDERARARAGYGLCLSIQGDDDKADKYFEWAIKLSPGVTSWISRERGESAYSKKRGKPSPAKAKTVDPL